MNRMNIVLIGTAMGVTACNTGSVAASTGLVPSAYHGAYNRTQTGCADVRAPADAELVISESRLQFRVMAGNFDGAVACVENGENSGIIVTARTVAGGEPPQIVLHLHEDPASTNLEAQIDWRRPGQREPGGMSAPIFMERCDV